MFEQHLVIINLLESVFNLFGWWGVAGLLAVDAATGMAPATVILTLSGWLLISLQQQPVTMVFLGSACVALGSSLGASLTYWVARLGGPAMVNGLSRKLRIKPHTVTRVEQQFNKFGAWLIIIGRFLPGVRQLVSIPAGLARMPFWKFLASTLIGSYIWSLVYVSAGFFLGEEWPKLSQLAGKAVPYVLIAAALGASIGLVVWLLSRRRAQPCLEC